MITRGSVRGQPRRLLGIPPTVLGAIAVAWALALAAQATGRGRLLGHDELIHSGLPLWAALGLHLLAWQVMVAAMMLPSSLPLVRLFATVSRNQERPGVAMSAFLAGYAVVWSVFGALAFLGDALTHDTVDATPWLATHPAVIGGGALALAGAFQFSSLKDRCLRECLTPPGSCCHATSGERGRPSGSAANMVCSASAAAGRSCWWASPPGWRTSGGWPR